MQLFYCNSKPADGFVFIMVSLEKLGRVVGFEEKCKAR